MQRIEILEIIMIVLVACALLVSIVLLYNDQQWMSIGTTSILGVMLVALLVGLVCRNRIKTSIANADSDKAAMYGNIFSYVSFWLHTHPAINTTSQKPGYHPFGILFSVLMYSGMLSVTTVTIMQSAELAPDILRIMLLCFVSAIDVIMLYTIYYTPTTSKKSGGYKSPSADQVMLTNREKKRTERARRTKPDRSRSTTILSNNISSLEEVRSITRRVE